VLVWGCLIEKCHLFKKDGLKFNYVLLETVARKGSGVGFTSGTMWQVNLPGLLTMNLSSELYSLFVLAIPIACIAWTVTHEEVFREPREFCVKRSQEASRLYTRKFFYLFTCEYCFSHYVTIFFLIITDFKLLYPDWRGYLIGGFALVWIANIYMSIYALVRIDIRKERVITKKEEKIVKDIDQRLQQ
jgi:hypothetical protein